MEDRVLPGASRAPGAPLCPQWAQLCCKEPSLTQPDPQHVTGRTACPGRVCQGELPTGKREASTTWTGTLPLQHPSSVGRCGSRGAPELGSLPLPVGAVCLLAVLLRGREAVLAEWLTQRALGQRHYKDGHPEFSPLCWQPEPPRASHRLSVHSRPPHAPPCATAVPHTEPELRAVASSTGAYGCSPHGGLTSH